jgi:uncharacterized protein
MATSVIKSYYDALQDRRILAARCSACEGLTFPPTTMCEHCGSASVEHVELSGRGQLIFVSHNIAPAPNPRFAELAPYTYGHIRLEEGVYVQGIVTNIEPDPVVLADYFEKGPVDVVADIIEVQGLPILAFKTI